jgi:hypothetical protein
LVWKRKPNAIGQLFNGEFSIVDWDAFEYGVGANISLQILRKRG